MTRPRSLALLVLLTACYRSHDPAACEAAPPRCATRASPCEPLELVTPSCDGESWLCPRGSEPFAAPWSDATCLPRVTAAPALTLTEAPVPVPIDGVCSWVFPTASTPPSLVALPVTDSCASLGAPSPLTSAPGAYDYLALQASFLDVHANTRVLARAWRFDAQVTFGVESVGVGLGTLHGHDLQLASPLLFDNALDLGDAALIDAGFLYAYGCPGTPQWLEEDCIVGRAPLAQIDQRAAWTVWGEGGWGVGKALRVFGSGPHRGPVVRDPRGGFLHIYAVGFGSTIEASSATRPEGPWSTPSTLATCQLPGDDPGAYCAGPIVHLELFDPTEPDKLVISYSIGTTSTDGAQRRVQKPASYWPHIERIRR